MTLLKKLSKIQFQNDTTAQREQSNTKRLTLILQSRLDFFNSILYGITSDQLNRLQHIQNCAAQLILKKRKHDHITPLLIALHWLPVEFRIQFKLAVFAFQHSDGTLPLYLSSDQPTRSFAQIII